MSIAKRSDGRYIVKFKDGERWKQRSFRSWEEAEKFDAECQYDASEKQRPTLLEAVLLYVQNSNLSRRRVKMYEFVVLGGKNHDGSHRKGPAEHLASRYADTLNRRDLESVRQVCRELGQAAASINLYTGLIKTTLSWCADQDILPLNPWSKYKNLPAKHDSRQGTLDDFRKIYPNLPPWLQWAAETALALCLRPGMSELFSLKWSAFDWRARAVTVYMPKTKATKIVYPPEVYLASAWIRFQAAIAAGQEYVCPGRRGRKFLFSNTYKEVWDRACEKAGVKMPMYALRHIAASEMLAAGADLAAVAAQLGHKNISTTGAFYAHAVEKAQRAAARCIPAIVPCTEDGAVLVQDGADF